jgi:hypothetical protein
MLLAILCCQFALGLSLYHTLPVGSVIIWTGPIEKLPEKYLECDGRLLPGDYYRNLRNVLDPSATGDFRLPDLQSQFVKGAARGFVGKRENGTIGTHSHTGQLTGGGHVHYVEGMSFCDGGGEMRGTFLNHEDGPDSRDITSFGDTNYPQGEHSHDLTVVASGTMTRPKNFRIVFAIRAI